MTYVYTSTEISRKRVNFLLRPGMTRKWASIFDRNLLVQGKSKIHSLLISRTERRSPTVVPLTKGTRSDRLSLSVTPAFTL